MSLDLRLVQMIFHVFHPHWGDFLQAGFLEVHLREDYYYILELSNDQ